VAAARTPIPVSKIFFKKLIYSLEEIKLVFSLIFYKTFLG
jgi:hypothetical protein